MVERVWSASSAGSASTASNWSGGVAPTSSDTVVFNNTSVVNCTWDITAVSTITVASTYTGLITVNTDIDLNGLSCSRVGAFTASANRLFDFSGTSPYNSNKTFFQIGIPKDTSIFVNETARRLFTFTYSGSTTGIKYEAGEYPNIVLASGSHTPDYIQPSLSANTATAVKFYSLNLKSGSFAPSSLTPTTADRDKEWISQGTTQNQFKIDSGVGSFDGGYATWTFQGIGGGFILPTNGSTTYNGCRFKWQKWIIDSSIAGAGSLGKIGNGSSVFLNDLTINAGAAISGDNQVGGTFYLTNKPTIRGTWGFYPIADGIYVYKGLHTLNVADGGTGLQSVTNGRIPFGSTSASLNTNQDLTFENNTLHASKGIKITEGADHPINPATGTGIIWVKNTTPSTLIFTDDAGTDTTLGSGSGGSSGTVTSVAVSGSDGIQVDSGSPITTSGTIALGVDKNTLLSHINVDDGADVTNATTVEAAGALMDSEVTNLAQVKAFDSADYATAAQNGTITSVATTAPITGGTITSTGTVGFDISGLTANTAIADADLLLLDDGANGTNRKITFTEVKEWIRGEGIKHGTNSRDGGVNQLRIRDSRDDGELTPDDFLSKQVSFDFTDDLAGSTNTWDGVMTMKGWSDSYRVFQLYSSASSEGSSGKDTEPLYFRSGEDTGWGALRQVLTFPGTTPNADGSAGQVLQTDGSGVLSWATISGGGGSYTDADAISAIEGEADLELTGTVVISDVASADSVDALLELKSVENAQARMFISADTDVKLPVFHLRDIEANGGTRNHHYSAYLALDRASAIVTGSAQNDFLIVQGNYNKKMHFCTNNAGNGSQAQARMTIDKDGKVGVGTTSPAQNLDVAGTIRQDASTNAVLVSDGNGDIVSASNLADVAYLQAGAAGQDVFNPANPGNWQGGPPADIEQAIQRIAAQLVALGGPIP